MPVGVIAAAGAGRRIGPDAGKLDIEVRGRPLLFYSLEAFQSAESITSIVLAVGEDVVDRWSPPNCWELGITKAKVTLRGGSTRQESVRLALERISEGDELVVVHDGARPLVKPEFIDRMVEELSDYDGIVPGLPLTDTVKEIARDRMVLRTLDRKDLVAVQTPQVFPLEVLRRAHERAVVEGLEATDDASLVELTGGSVKIIAGDRTNLKVTYPEDLVIAETFMGGRIE